MSWSLDPAPGEVVVECSTRIAEVVVHRTEETAAASPELVAAGVRAAVTVRLAAGYRSWGLSRVVVRLRETDDRQVRDTDRIEMELILEGFLDDWQRRYLRSVAETDLRRSD